MPFSLVTSKVFSLLLILLSSLSSLSKKSILSKVLGILICTISESISPATAIFNKLDGTYYTFKKDSLNRNYKRIYERYINNLNYYFKDKNINFKYKKIYGKKKVEQFNFILENLMKAFDFNDTIIYRTSFVNVFLRRQLKKEKNNNHSIIKKVIKTKNLNKNFISKELINYIYDELLKNKKQSKILNNLLMLFPDSFMCAIYLKTIIK